MKLVSTLGWSASVVINGAKILNPDKNVVVYGYVNSLEEKRVKVALEEVKKALGEVVEVHIENPMDFYECTIKVEKHLDDDAVANITGGTKIMAFSLALKAAVLDLPVIYVVTRDNKTFIKYLPIRLSGGSNFFRMNDCDSTSARLLKVLINKYGGTGSMKELLHDLNAKYSTLSDAKNKLVRANLITEMKVGREKILMVNKSAYLFMGGCV